MQKRILYRPGNGTVSSVLADIHRDPDHTFTPDRQTDQLVYQLYGLTQDEIRIGEEAPK